MNLRLRPQNLGLLLAAAVAAGGSLVCLPAPQASAQAILQREGLLQSMQGEHTFSGTAGQAVLIQVESSELSTFLTLLDPSGQEIAVKEDYDDSLDSALVATLPSNGTYQVLTRSLSGTGGDYRITVRVATPYEQAYARATSFMQEGKYPEAVAAYNEAIRIDPNQPRAYQNLANALYGQAQMLLPNEREAIVNSYQRALELYERTGDAESAQMLRDQIMYLQPQP